MDALADPTLDTPPAAPRAADAVLEGELTIGEIAAQHAMLLPALGSGDEDGLSLDLGAIEACDSAGVQLLLAAAQGLAEQGRTLRLSACSEPVRAVLRCYGLQHLLPGVTVTPGADR